MAIAKEGNLLTGAPVAAFGFLQPSPRPLPPVLAPYVPDFRYVLCDLSTYDDEALQGAMVLQVGLRLLKHIGDSQLGAQLPSILGLLGTLSDQQTALDALRVMLRYVALGSEAVTVPDVQQAIRVALPHQEETLMASLAQQWIEQGRQLGLERGLQQGRALGLIQLLEKRFGALDEAQRQQILKAEGDVLTVWYDRLLDAPTLEALLTISSASGPEER